jgi:diadenosine tetraphosphate (Ap4A) HIT family hydrolase
MDILTCPFCSPEKKDIIFENELWYARWDAFPATRGHVLVIPFRHLTGYFDTTLEEHATLPEMLFACKKILDAKFEPTGYNIVINIGEAADQRVMHCHIHMIPRYSGDKNNPTVSIREFILKQPGRGVVRYNQNR